MNVLPDTPPAGADPAPLPRVEKGWGYELWVVGPPRGRAGGGPARRPLPRPSPPRLHQPPAPGRADGRAHRRAARAVPPAPPRADRVRPRPLGGAELGRGPPSGGAVARSCPDIARPASRSNCLVGGPSATGFRR